MVCTASDLQEWKDFPKGLRVLLLGEDIDSASEIRSKLEEMDYIVSTFYNEDEALSAVSTKPESFHVAIIEVNISNSNESFKFLENTKDLPTIMTSNIHCLSTMMKCIALGAVEFLHKPLSEDKLRNIWQHVVHKAFNAGGSSISESLKPVKESIVSMMQLQLESEAPKENVLIKPETVSRDNENDHEKSAGNEKYPAPSTPQLKQVARLLDDGDCHDQANCSTEKESGEQDGESKSVETTCDNSMAVVIHQMDKPRKPNEIVVKKENDSADGCMAEIAESPPNPHIKGSARCLAVAPENTSKAPGLSTSCVTKANRKKTKVDWTPELHKKFVQAVEQLGVDQTIPSRILELMKVDGLTRHNVASHLQKYRMQRRHILPKEDDRKWPHSRDPTQRNYFPNKPIMAYPPYHPNIAIQPGPVYPVWGALSNHQGGVHMWGPPAHPPWQPTESWHWKPPHLGIQSADAWGCPVMPPPSGPCSPFPQNVAVYHSPRAVDNSFSMPQGSFDLQPAEEVIDRVVKEAINKPWLPLPIGLRPPATDSVLAELSRQGISSIPPHVNNPNSY